MEQLMHCLVYLVYTKKNPMITGILSELGVQAFIKMIIKIPKNGFYLRKKRMKLIRLNNNRRNLLKIQRVTFLQDFTVIVPHSVQGSIF